LFLQTFSDALAAVGAVIYGPLRSAPPDGMKTFEGSLAFFLCSFVCVHVPLLLLTDRGRAETLLIAVLLAWLATMFEAIAWGGLGNLVLALVSPPLFILYLGLSGWELVIRLAGGGGGGWRRRG